MKSLAPILLFTYKRLDTLQLTVESLQKNKFALESNLFVFSDNAKNEEDYDSIKKVRSYLKTINGFKNVVIYEAKNNKGLANSIIEGVGKIFEKYEKVIVLEDDLIIAKNFLSFMNENLNFYEDNDKIFSISGYGFKIKKPQNYYSDVYMYGRSSSWGWGTWKNRWQTVDWAVEDWNVFSKDKKQQKLFNRHGSDMFSMLKSCINGNNNSWAIRFCYSQFKQNKYTIFPFLSKVENIGFDQDATNCTQSYSRFKITMDNSDNYEFLLDKNIIPNKSIHRECYYYQSLYMRLFSKIMILLKR